MNIENPFVSHIASFKFYSSHDLADRAKEPRHILCETSTIVTSKQIIRLVDEFYLCDHIPFICFGDLPLKRS